MRYIISNDYVLGRDWNDVRDRIASIRRYIAANTTPDEKIVIHKFVEIFEDHEGYTRSDVCMAVLGLIEEGVLRHQESDIVRSKS
jgi:uncharacterized protein with NRDE domain